MSRPGRKNTRAADDEEETQRLRTSSATMVTRAGLDENDDDWETSSEDGAIMEEGLGPLDDEEFVEEDEDEEMDEAYAELQSEAKQASLEKNMKGVTFDEAALAEQQEEMGAAIWRSDMNDSMNEEGGMAGEQLEYSNKAYDSFFQLRTEYPFLSFDVVMDTEGSNRAKYPLSMLLVCGSQADEASKNHLALLRIRNICRTKHDVLSDEDSEDSFIGGDQEEGGSDEDDDAEEVNDGEPMVDHRLIRHHGSANRVRVSPFATFGGSQYVAVWSDAGHVQVFDIDSDARALVDFANWSKEESAAWKDKKPVSSKQSNAALRFCTPSSSHKVEGYGLAWSALKQNVFASGDCYGSLYLWQPSDDGRWKAFASSAPNCESPSIEEINFSPTQPDVLLTARAEGVVEVWDSRDMRSAKLQWQADTSDINVADWNRAKQASHLLVTGAESGAVAVWDLRKTAAGGSNGAKVEPIQNLVWHKKRITSVEFSRHNESVLQVTSDDGQCTLWDLSLERDPSEEQEMVGELFGRSDLTGIPDPLMFQHQGLHLPKEAHWHPQIPGMVVTTDYNGLQMFKPMNWRSLMK